MLAKIEDRIKIESITGNALEKNILVTRRRTATDAEKAKRREEADEWHEKRAVKEAEKQRKKELQEKEQKKLEEEGLQNAPMNNQ